MTIDVTELRLLAAKEAAALLDTLLPGTGFGTSDRGVKKLYELGRHGVLPTIRIGRRRFWSPSALRRFAENGGAGYPGNGWRKLPEGAAHV
jgi:hypothetical protein